MYWEQLELRCRTLYSQPPPPTVSTVGTLLSTPRQNNCRCCEQCHAHRNMAQNFPWDPNSFWIPGQAAGNFYSPNPGDDLVNAGSRSLRRTPGWSWPRMPWQRSDRFRATPSSPDSQYGFSAVTNVPDPTLASIQSNYALLNGPGYGIWGPPPPYSDPNSPARRGRYPFMNSMQCQQVMMPEQMQQQQSGGALTQNVVLECHQRTSSAETADVMMSQQHQQLQLQQQQQQHQIFRAPKRQSTKSKENHSDSDGASRDKVSSTLPVRKSKKRHGADNGAKSVGPNLHQRHPTAQEVFSRPQIAMDHEPYVQPNAPSCSTSQPTQPVVTQSRSRRIKMGVENSAFQPIEQPTVTGVVEVDQEGGKESGDSDVYYGDVSSCCNVSVQNDNNLDESGQNAQEQLQESFTAEEVDDYLAQRFGKRDTSTRSRLPFPQIPELYEQRQQPRDKSRYSVPKDQSRQSMCSVDSSGEKTDFTDLSPATPAGNNNGAPTFQDAVTAVTTTTQQRYSDAFVASYPYSSNEQSQEAYKRLTKTIQDVFCDSESSPLTMINYDSDATNSYHHSSGSSSNNNLSCRSPKASSHSLTPAKRNQNLSSSSTVTSPGGGSSKSCVSNGGDRRL